MRIMSWRRRRRGDRLRRTSRALALRRRYCKSLERERKRRGSHSPFNNAVDPFGIRNGRVYLRAEDRMRSDDKASAVHFLMKRLHESCKSLTQPFGENYYALRFCLNLVRSFPLPGVRDPRRANNTFLSPSLPRLPHFPEPRRTSAPTRS